MRKFDSPPFQDQRLLDAAEGWIGLNNYLEANEELEKISPGLRAYPEVLVVRWKIYAQAKKWEACVDIGEAIVKLAPELEDGWINRSYALHELKRTKEAYDLLLPAQSKYPDNHTLAYNLACYSCQLGQLKESMEWLEKAIDLASEEDIRVTALEDDDLEPLWAQIGEI